MANVSTNLMSALLNNESIDEVFRSDLENAVNEVLSTELTAFLDYEKYDYSGRNSGDSRNGFYDRTYQSRFGTLNLKIPRDREGLFKQHIIPSYQRSSNELETTIIQLYKKGITTREISDLIEKMYGHYYIHHKQFLTLPRRFRIRLSDSIIVLLLINTWPFIVMQLT